MHCLYLVSTPIGNLEDITLRALRVLKESSLIAAEDTRKTGQLLAKYGIKVPLCSYYEHSLPGQTEYILSRLETGDVAVVSEAGMPGISDPGYELVVSALEKGIKVVPVPGPSAVTSAVAVSGLPTDRFLYMGFLPRKKAERQRVLAGISALEATIVIFEAPHRLRASLNDIMLTLGNRRISVCREMTKLYEEIFRGPIQQAIEYFTSPRGEFTLVIEGAGKAEPAGVSGEMMLKLAGMKKAGMKARDAVTAIAMESGLNRREIYQAWLNINNK